MDASRSIKSAEVADLFAPRMPGAVVQVRRNYS